LVCCHSLHHLYSCPYHQALTSLSHSELMWNMPCHCSGIPRTHQCSPNKS
jgi:hypothetical protein